MPIQSLWLRRGLRFCVVAVLLFVAVLIASCWYFRVSRFKDMMAYVGMAQESHPVWKKLALRQINAGDSAAEFVANNPPTSRTEFGRYGVYGFVDGGELPGYFSLTGLEVISRDGVLIHAYAGSCTWKFTFFDDEDPDFDAQYIAYIHEQLALRDKNAAQQAQEATSK